MKNYISDESIAHIVKFVFFLYRKSIKVKKIIFIHNNILIDNIFWKYS